MSQVFFSYSHKDAAEVERIRLRVLDNSHFAGNVWIDTKRMEAGQDLNRMMYDGIHGSTHVVCFLTGSYAASEPCMFELKLAHTLGRAVIPVVLHPDTEAFPFGSDDLADLLPDTILRIEEHRLPAVVSKVVQCVEAPPLSTVRTEPVDVLRRRASREGPLVSHRGSPSELEAADFVARQGFTDNDLRNVRRVVRQGQGDLVNSILKDDLSLGARFALLRMANDAPSTQRY